MSACTLQHAAHQLVAFGQPGRLVDEPGAADLLARQLASAQPAANGHLVRRTVFLEVAGAPLGDRNQAHRSTSSCICSSSIARRSAACQRLAACSDIGLALRSSSTVGTRLWNLLASVMAASIVGY